MCEQREGQEEIRFCKSAPEAFDEDGMRQVTDGIRLGAFHVVRRQGSARKLNLSSVAARTQWYITAHRFSGAQVFGAWHLPAHVGWIPRTQC